MTGSDAIQLTEDTLAERSSLNGESAAVQAVDMVFIGSETGQLELRYHTNFRNSYECLRNILSRSNEHYLLTFSQGCVSLSA